MLCLSVIDAQHPDRKEAEQWIRQCFALAYGADLQTYMPDLLALYHESGGVRGLLGWRSAEHCLFLEQYFDEPIEQVIEQRFHQTIDRSDCVEVGNLAEAVAGGGRELILLSTFFLYGAGFTWVLITAVKALVNSFKRMGLHLELLGQADPMRLSSAERARWGRYYDTSPVVLLGNIEEAYHFLYRYDRFVPEPILALRQQTVTLGRQWAIKHGRKAR